MNSLFISKYCFIQCLDKIQINLQKAKQFRSMQKFISTERVFSLQDSSVWLKKLSVEHNAVTKVFKACVSISSGQRNLMKTYLNEANTGGITKIALKKFLDFF